MATAQQSITKQVWRPPSRRHGSADKANPETNHTESSGGIKTVQEADCYARGDNGAAQEANPVGGDAGDILPKAFRRPQNNSGGRP